MTKHQRLAVSAALSLLAVTATAKTLTARWSDVWGQNSDVEAWSVGELDFTAQKGPDATAPPRYAASTKELKIFATSSLTVSCQRVMTHVAWDMGSRTQMGEITCSSGRIVEQGAKTLAWEGEATTVTFTVSRYADCATNESNRFKPGQFFTKAVTVTTRDEALEPIQITPRGGDFDNAVDVSLECATPGATLAYRLPDGTEHEADGRTEATVDCSGTLLALAQAGDEQCSASAEFRFACAQPRFATLPLSEVADGAYIKVECGTRGARLRYTTDSTEPGEGSPLVPDDGIEMRWTCPVEIKVKAFKDGYEASGTETATFFPVGATPSRLDAEINFASLGLADNQELESLSDRYGTVTVELLQGSHPTMAPRYYAKTPSMRLFKGNAMRVTCHRGRILEVRVHGTATSYRFVGSADPEGYLVSQGADATYRSRDTAGVSSVEFTQSPYAGEAARMASVTVTYIPSTGFEDVASGVEPEARYYDLLGRTLGTPAGICVELRGQKARLVKK